MGTFQKSCEESEDPCREGLEAVGEPGMAKADSPGLEGETKALTFFKKKRKELKAEIEEQHEIPHREAETAPRQEKPAEAPGQFKGGSGCYEMRREENDGREPEEEEHGKP
jgi:hypothetical protein